MAVPSPIMAIIAAIILLIPISISTLQQQVYAKGITPGNSTINFPPPTYKIKVKFDSIKIQETHDPGILTSQSDGEYDLYAFVQGVPIGLTDRSFDGICGGSGDPLPCGLGDVSHGETVYFSPLAEITVDIPETLPLSIFTAGVEVDNCGRIFDTQVATDKVMAILKQPEETWAQSVQVWADGRSYPYGHTATCFLNFNDPLGSIVKFYKPPAYGAGAHEEFANNADYILRYTITVVPPPNLDQKKTVLNTGNNFSVN